MNISKIQTFLRLLVVGLLIYPMPLVMGAEVTVNEDFSDSTYQAGLTISGGNQNAFIYDNEQNRYGTTGPSLAITTGTYTFTFSTDIKVYEAAFLVSAVNNEYSVTWNYSNSTNETEIKSGQSYGENGSNMYDNFSKSFTSFNADAANTDRFITSFAVTLTDISLLDTLSWKYDDSVSTGSFATTTTTTLVNGIGDPTNLTTSANLHSGEITIDWDEATGYQYDAERYAIAFSNDNFQSVNYAVSTGNVGDANALNTTYTFSKSYLVTVLGVEAGDTVSFKVRADNDTNSQYSNWTSVTSYTILDTAAGPTNITISNTEYQGLDFTWTAPATGWGEPTSFMIDFSTEGAPYEVDPSVVTTITGITQTSYTIENINAGTYYMRVLACTQDGSNCHGQSNGSTTVTVNANTSVTTTTTLAPVKEVYVEPYVEPEPLPPPPEEIIVDVVIEGVDKTYTQADVNDGTTSRDQERADNEYMFGCFMTNAQIDRGDCQYEEDNYANDGYLADPTDETDDMPIYDETKVKQDSDIIEFDEKDTTDVEDELFEGDDIILNPLSEEDFKVLYEDVFTEIQDLTFFANDGWSEDGTECFEEECNPLTEEQIEEQEAFFEEFVETYLEVDKFFEENKDIYIVEEEELFTEIPQDVIIIFEEEPLEQAVEEIIFLEELAEEEILDFTEEEYEDYKVERKEIIETYVDELEEEILEEVLPETVTVQEFQEIKDKDIEELTEEELEIVVDVATEVIEEVVDTEQLTEIIESEDIIILEEAELQELTEEELDTYEEEVQAVITEYVQELATEELVVVVEQVADVGVENLASADKQTVQVIQAVVTEVVNVETVEELSVEEVEAVGELLGFTEEEAAEDVQIIAEQASKDENTATAVEEFVERAIISANVENFSLADVVTEVQIEAFLENPVQEIFSVNLDELDISTIGQDMTSDQREKAQEVVVPVIIASQIIAQAGALMTRRF